MSPKRADEISIKLRHEAKEIYDNLPKKGKGEYVSDAIIEKHTRYTGTDLAAQVQDHEARLRKLEKGGKE